jgi:TPR repeat protein
MGVRDPAEAAKLLWKAVSKQNATAAVLLSDLYLRGDGVPRSCDQARLLLVAAAKRGSPLAAQQLRNLESHGCR